ncbi:cation:proton antiporter [Nodosilinea sp. E11]|uniref:cation:proton antiporter n=1 Tax=Nodosilinea sp. E11 TaxID=3037479 RepID=UPI002934F2FF|nr:cation:proton antiporter [Nodosilinea sp. E11]WOD39586.1 cation:proton antiporter [Nodosilinea sp. E11]
MTEFTILWIALPLFIGFSIPLLPSAARLLTLGIPLFSVAYATALFSRPAPLDLRLLDSFGVALWADQLSAWFILTNALVTAAVLIYSWDGPKTKFFYTQLLVLHGSVNATFICADLISLYVALEVVGMTTFLLIAYPRTDRTLWVALRYLFISNVAMLFYLVGAVLVYRTHQSFAFEGLRGAPAEAPALILMALLTKGGIFVSGLWLPATNTAAESQISAMMSGAVEKAGVFPLLRFALVLEEFEPIVQAFGVATAVLGVTYALAATDAKRVLACSTLSQLGWLLVAPAVAGFYALAHGLAKAALFLTVGQLPQRDLATLRQQPMPTALWLPLTLGGLSISGAPLLAGFGAKTLTLEALGPWQGMAMNGAAVGTAAVYAKLISLPHRGGAQTSSWPQVPLGLGLALGLLLGGAIAANVAYLDAYSGAKLIKALVLIGAGWLVYALLRRPAALELPAGPEAFEHLLGGMGVMLIVLFWMVWSWSIT